MGVSLLLNTTQYYSILLNSRMGWHQGLFNFCGDCSVCLCGTFCVPCLICTNARAMDKSGCLYNILSCLLPCLPTFLLRQEARERYGVEGSCLGDVVESSLCTPCVNCQTAAEIEHRGGYRKQTGA